MYRDVESPDTLSMASMYKNSSSYTVGISPPPPPLLTTVPKEGLVYEPIRHHTSHNHVVSDYLTNKGSNKAIQLVEVDPSLIPSRRNGVVPPSPMGLCKSLRSSCSDESDDSDSDASSTGGSSRSSSSKVTTITAPEFYHMKKSTESRSPSIVHNRHLLPLGQQNQQPAVTTAQFLQHSAFQPLITYPPSQPLYIQPSLDGRSQQILVPIATVPLSGNNNTASKITSCGPTPQGPLYLQASPLVQGTNSSQTLQLATVPSNFDATAQSKPQQLLRSAPGTLPIYINGHSAQILPQSSQPIQIVTLANTPHVHS